MRGYNMIYQSYYIAGSVTN